MARACRVAMQPLQLRVFAQPARRRAVLEERVELDPARHRGSAAMPRYDQRAACIGVGAAAFQRFIANPAPEEARHECVARAQDVVDIDGKARTLEAVLDVVGNCLRKHDAAHRPPLDHQRARREFAQALQRCDRVGAAAGDVDLLLGADHEVAQRDHRLQMRADFARLHVPALSEAGAGQPPQHRPVVDVERDPRAGVARFLHCRDAGRIGLRLRQVRAGDAQCNRRRNELRIEIRWPRYSCRRSVRDRTARETSRGRGCRGWPVRSGAWGR